MAAISSAGPKNSTSCLSLLNPITLLQKLVQKVAQTIFRGYEYVTRKIFGTILRISVFQLGEYNKFFPFILMRFYQLAMCDPKERNSIDPKRLEASKGLLMQFGGKETELVPKDGLATIRCMHMKSEDFFEKFYDLGAEKKTILYKPANASSDDSQPLEKEEERQVFLAKDGCSKEAYQKILEHADKFFLEKIEIQTPQGVKTAILLPPSVRLEKRATMILNNSPGRSYEMKRREIAAKLLMGFDLVLWNPRNVIYSTGTPSEGASYLDTEAVYEYTKSLGVLGEDIYISGYCHGAAFAAHVIAKYYNDGVNFILENAFDSLEHLAKRQNWAGKHFFERSLPEIQSQDPEITKLVKQDGFDICKKLKSVTPSSPNIRKPKIVIIHTRGDKTVPPDSVENLVAAAKDNFEVSTLEYIPKQAKDPHLLLPSEMRDFSKEYVGHFGPNVGG